MLIRELMTASPTCCSRGTSLREVAQMMVQEDCGAIPVVESTDDHHIVGVITDRDIVCRAVAEGKNPQEMTAEDCMTGNVITVNPEMTVEECCELMELHQIRRVAVLDHEGVCCGMVAQADIALRASEAAAAEVVREVSHPSLA